MAAILSFNGRTIIDDSPSATATAFTSGGLWGVCKLLAQRQEQVRLESYAFPGARGMEMKALGMGDTEEASRQFIFATDYTRPTIVHHSSRANMWSWLQSVEEWRRNPDNLHGSLVWDGRTFANMVWVEFQPGVLAIRSGLAPGGNSKAVAVPLFLRFVAADAAA